MSPKNMLQLTGADALLAVNAPESVLKVQLMCSMGVCRGKYRKLYRLRQVCKGLPCRMH